MGSSLFVVGLGEPLHQIFKDIAHIHCGNAVGTHIQIFCGKIHNDLIEHPRLNHAIYLRLEVHTGKNLLHIIRKPNYIIPKIVFDVFRISNQLGKGILTSVIKLIAGSLFQKADFQFSKALVLLICLQHCIMCGKEAIVKALDHTHGQDYQSIFMGLEGAKKGVCGVPDQVCVFLRAPAYFINFLFTRTHHSFPPLLCTC